MLNELKTRVSDHGKEIDDIQVKVADHDARIHALENTTR